MANKTLNVRIQNKYDTEANWASKNPVLLKGEAAYSSDKNGLYKIGDGTSKWSDLKYNSANTLVNHTSGEGFEFGYANSKTITIPKTTAVTTYYIQIAQKANFRFKNYYVKTSGNNTQYSFQAEISANAYMEPHVTLNTQKYNDSEVKSILICKNSTNSYHHDIYLVVNSSTSVAKTIYIWSDNTILDTVSTTAPTTATELNVNITNDSYIYTSKKIQANITGSAGSVAWGNITGKPSTYYTHPSYTARSSGLYKVTVDATGHVSGATAVSKADITALGIPGTDTNTWRGVQNNLTSTATDQSLSAAQGKILNELTFQKKKAIDATVDWDTLKEFGCYKIQMASWGDAATKHSPNAYGNVFQFGLLLVFRGYDADTENRTVQIYIPHKADANVSSVVLMRMLNGTGWQAWHPIARGTGWSDIINKPTTFTPSSHTHDDRYYTESEINSKLATYLPLAGGTMTGNLAFSNNKAGISWARASDGASILFNAETDATDNYLEFHVTDDEAVNFKWTKTVGSENLTLGTWKREGIRLGVGSFIGSLTGNVYGNVYLNTTQSVIQNQMDTSNYTSPITWKKGGKGWYYKDSNNEDKKYTYDPQIGQHNTGNDGNGSIVILPYATNTSPWGGQVGLYIGKNNLKLDGNNVLHTGNYNNYSPTKTGGGASGTWGISVSGNSATTTKLITARSINGTNFDGTGNITTATWGTARNITIGNTKKSVNGSADVSWSLSEIGAAAASHSHSYLPLNGGTLTGALNISRGSVDKVSPTSQDIVINVPSTDETKKSPGIGFHVAGKNYATLKYLSDGSFRFYNSTLASYVPVYASFYGNLSGNATTATNVAWSGVTGKPSTFTPSSHTHNQYYDSGISRAANTVLAAPNGANGTATFRKLVAADIPTLTKSKISDFPTSLAPTAGSNNYVRVYNSKDIGNSSTVTFNDLAKQHFAMGMINGATDNPYGAAKWAHGISMAWSNGANTSWISQIALGVQEGTGMWYRTSAGSGTIVGRTWNRVLDSSNYSSYAATKGHTHDLSTMINTLTTGTSAPTDSDYYVTQYAGGGTTTTSYHRRPHSALWTYIKSKADAVYQPKGSYAAANHTHNYAGSSSAGGAATSANKLNTNAGSATQPVYFSGGVPVACTHTLGKSVPADAKFTDTNTWRPLGTTGDTACAGNDSRLSNARPASDVYAWAKASSKPSYSWGEITGKPGAFNPSSHNHRDLDAIGSVGYYGSDVANSNGWYKVYSTTLTGYNDHVARLSIVSGYNPYASGLLILHLRCNNTTSLNVQQLIWETRQGFNADDVIINTNGNTWTLYLKITNTQYGRVKIRVLESTSTVNNWSISLSNNNTKESTNPKATATAKDGAIVNYANSAGSVAWSGISGKPSLVGKTIKSLTAASSSGWSDLTSAQNLIPDMSVIAYWNGAYSNTSSNLAYCNKGAFGTIVTKNAGDYATAGHTHHYAGSSSAGGSATSAVKLDTSTAGSATQPVYFTGGKPVACTYTLGKSVPSNAVFTDTNNKMTQTAITSKDYTNWRTILWGASNSGKEGFTPTTVTDGAFTDTNLSYQPSTGTLRAKVFKGDLYQTTTIGNSTATECSLNFLSNAKLSDGSYLAQNYRIVNDRKTDFVFGIKTKNNEWASYCQGTQVYFKNSSADISALAGKMLPPVLTDFSGSKDSPGAGTGRVLSIASNVDAKIIKFRIFTSSSATTATTVNVTYSTSDIRLKDNVKDTDVKDALSVINKMKIRQFDWKDDNKHQKIGFVADELEELDDKLVVGGGWEDEEHTQMNVKGVDTFYMMGYVVKGMQELSKQIKALTEENKELKRQIEGLKREG